MGRVEREVKIDAAALHDLWVLFEALRRDLVDVFTTFGSGEFTISEVSAHDGDGQIRAADVTELREISRQLGKLQYVSVHYTEDTSDGTLVAALGPRPETLADLQTYWTRSEEWRAQRTRSAVLTVYQTSEVGLWLVLRAYGENHHEVDGFVKHATSAFSNRIQEMAGIPASPPRATPPAAPSSAQPESTKAPEPRQDSTAPAIVLRRCWRYVSNNPLLVALVIAALAAASSWLGVAH